MARPKGNIKREILDGLSARVCLHEYDHLKGITFTQRIDNTDIIKDLLYVTSLIPEIELIVEKASEFAAKYGHTYVTTEHLSLALINYKNFRTMLEEFGTDWQGLNDAFIKYPKENKFGKRKQSLDKK